MILRYNTSNGGVAQGLEQRAHNLLVVGSIPTAPTTIINHRNQKTSLRVIGEVILCTCLFTYLE